MLNFFRKRSLKDALNETKSVLVEGVLFQIKKINVLDHLEGTNVLQKEFETYQVGGDKVPVFSAGLEKKMKAHYGDVILAGVIKPKIVRKSDNVHTTIDELFQNWTLADSLYNEIMEFTYGKKKLNRVR